MSAASIVPTEDGDCPADLSQVGALPQAVDHPPLELSRPRYHPMLENVGVELELAIAGAHGREVSFVGDWEPSTRTVTRVSLMARGSRTRTIVIDADLRLGQLVIHNHPGHGLLDPSDADLDVAKALGERGIGFLIINSSATSAYLVREPKASIVDAQKYRARCWRVGPLMLIWSRPIRPNDCS